MTGTRNGPIFVVGAPRSGTTLLQRMLRSHPRICSPTGESHFIIPLHRRTAEFGDLGNKNNMLRVLNEMHRLNAEFINTDMHGMRFDASTLADELHAKGIRTVQGLIGAVFQKNAEGEGKVRWLDKTPYYVLHLPTILALYPDAQFVHIIRDGRDSALSMLERSRDLCVYNLYHGAKLWQQYVEVGRDHGKELGSERYFELRYEDLLAEPENVMRSLCHFLDEEFSDSVIHFQKSTDPNTKTPLLKRELQSNNQDKWKTLMTQDQIRVFERAAGNTLRACGYGVTTDCRPFPLPVKAWYRLHSRAIGVWWDFAKHFTH